MQRNKENKNTDIDKMLVKYNKVLQKLKKKFNELQQDNKDNYNPIGHIKVRIKTKTSIKNKLKNKLNLDFTIKNIEDNLNDIAGIRIICPFLSDINKVISYITSDPDITIINIKNYIEDPKETGYSSYHMIVSLPILIDGMEEQVKAEIQIRTMAMDVIASLEHKIRYKSNVPFTKEDNEKIDSITSFVNLIDTYMDEFIQEKKNYPMPIIQEKSTKNKLPKATLNEFLKKYKIALKKVEDIINDIKNEYVANNMINPIEHIEGRIKTTTSITSKLEEKELNISLENIDKYITDVGAIKVICSFISDAWELISILKENTNFIILEEQDYITNPKPCGYSSYHFVVAVPIEVDGKITFAKIEIQVRTIIMDFWANIEHILCYKKEVNLETKEQLKRIASALRLIEPEIDELARNIFDQMKITKDTNKKVLELSLNPTKETTN